MTKWERKKKRAQISPRIARLITTEALRYPRKDRHKLAMELQKEIKGMREQPPALETLEKKISNARSNEPKAPMYWHLGAKTVTPIPAEAIPHILKVQKLMIENLGTDIMPIGQAIWIGRLYTVVTEPDKLFAVSMAYTLYEYISILSKQGVVDTKELDDLLRDGEIGTIAKIAEDLNNIILGKPKEKWQAASTEELDSMINMVKKEVVYERPYNTKVKE